MRHYKRDYKRHYKFFLALCFLITLNSCSPKDEKLIRPDSGSKVKTESNTSEDLIKLSFVAFDKQAEAFHLLKAIFNKDYAAQSKLTVETISEDAVKTVLHITSPEARSEGEKYAQVSQIDLLAQVTRDDAKNILEIVFKDNAAGKSIQNLFTKESGRLAEAPLLLVTNKSKRIGFTAKAMGKFDLETDSVDLLRTRSKKNSTDVYTDLSAVTSQSTFVWDGKEPALNEKIKLTALSFSHVKTSLVKSELMLSAESVGNLSIQLGPCASWNGDINFVSEKSKSKKPAGKVGLVLNDSSIQVSGQSSSFEALECVSRPVVDMRKLL